MVANQNCCSLLASLANLKPWNFPRMQRLINRAISGNRSARDLLDMYDEEIMPAVKTVMLQTLRAEFKYAGTQFFAAMHLQLKSLERMAKRFLVHLFWIDKHHFESSPLTGDATLIEEMSAVHRFASYPALKGCVRFGGGGCPEWSAEDGRSFGDFRGRDQ